MRSIPGFKILLFFSVFQPGFAQWDHSVFRATSPDGFNWTVDPVEIFYHASVPKAVKDSHGTIFLYFIYLPDSTSIETIRVATSIDGQHFTPSQPITIINNVTLNRFDPKPVLLPDGSIRLYYVDAGLIPPHDIYSAVSTDGINFTEEPGIRLVAPEITDPDVFKYESTWVLFAPTPSGMLRAVSNDGLTFTEDTTFYMPQASVFGTYKFQGYYRTYYCDEGDIVSMTSPDVYNFTKENGIRIAADVDEILCDPSMIEWGGYYILYYKSQPTGIPGIYTQDELPPVNIYPNPSGGSFYFEIPKETGKEEIFIYNVVGKKIHTTRIYERRTIIDLGDQPKGVYYYTVKNNGGIISSGKLILE